MFFTCINFFSDYISIPIDFNPKISSLKLTKQLENIWEKLLWINSNSSLLFSYGDRLVVDFGMLDWFLPKTWDLIPPVCLTLLVDDFFLYNFPGWFKLEKLEADEKCGWLTKERLSLWPTTIEAKWLSWNIILNPTFNNNYKPKITQFKFIYTLAIILTKDI